MIKETQEIVPELTTCISRLIRFVEHLAQHTYSTVTPRCSILIFQNISVKKILKASRELLGQVVSEQDLRKKRNLHLLSLLLPDIMFSTLCVLSIWITCQNCFCIVESMICYTGKNQDCKLGDLRNSPILLCLCETLGKSLNVYGSRFSHL